MAFWTWSSLNFESTPRPLSVGLVSTHERATTARLTLRSVAGAKLVREASAICAGKRDLSIWDRSQLLCVVLEDIGSNTAASLRIS